VVANLYDLRMMRGAGLQPGKTGCGISSIHYVSAQNRGKRAEGRREGLGNRIGHASTPSLLIFNMIWRYFLPKSYFK
jgi:hypothetical protein